MGARIPAHQHLNEEKAVTINSTKGTTGVITNITPEMIAAWRTLQAWALDVRAETGTSEADSRAAEAIDVLDDSDFMVPIERAGEGEGAEQHPIPQISTQCAMTGKMYRSDIQPLDPAEWGDTTRADMARHQREAAILAAGGEVRLASIPLSELNGEGLLRALRKSKKKRESGQES